MDILHGAPGYRPGFNAYMWADALAIVRTARLAGDEATARLYETKAAALKANLQRMLWDPKREFFFPMSQREEKDKDGNVVQSTTTTRSRVWSTAGCPGSA
jgi:neutral trehalase